MPSTFRSRGEKWKIVSAPVSRLMRCATAMDDMRRRAIGLSVMLMASTPAAFRIFAPSTAAVVSVPFGGSTSTPEFQDFITRFAWGTVWTRPGLDVRTRRLLVLAITAAMGRWEEFRLHVRTGLAHELEWCDLEEVLLQTAVYAGVPAGNTGLHAASEERDRIK